MRISDWSSDVCSSDLDSHAPASASRHVAADRVLGPIGRDRRRIDRLSRGRPRRRAGLGHLAQLRRHRLRPGRRTEEHTSELQSLMRNSYAGVCLKKKKAQTEPRMLRSAELNRLRKKINTSTQHSE